MKTKTKYLVILLIMGLFFPLLLNFNFNLNSEVNTNLINPKSSGAYIESFIHIDGSVPGNWSDTVTTYSWCSGDGSWSNPYIIENVTVDCGGTGTGILIENSNTEYFIVRNCTVYNTGNGLFDSGIKLENTCIGTIFKNNVSNNQVNGICLIGCNNNTIIENTANHNYLYGINLINNCDYNTISGNTVNYNSRGIQLYDYCDYNNISGNIVCNTTDIGILLYDYCGHNTISGNTVNDNAYGIYFENKCNNNTISGNTANDNPYDAIYLHKCDNNTISGNTANDNDCGIYFDDYCDNNTILGNHAFNNTNEGIYLVDLCDNNTITENALYNNTIGIRVESDNNNNSIYKNFFLENGIHAVDDGIDNKWNNTIIGNYWDNHTGPDVNPNDGVVDVPYTYIGGSAGSIDYLPIAEDGAPMITINSPSSGSIFGVSAPSFDVTITDTTLVSMWYTMDGGINNYTFTENGKIDQSAWDILPKGSITITFYAIDIVGNEAFEEVSVIKNVPSGLDPGAIITIVVISVVGGVAVLSMAYIYLKKRRASA